MKAPPNASLHDCHVTFKSQGFLYVQQKCNRKKTLSERLLNCQCALIYIVSDFKIVGCASNSVSIESEFEVKNCHPVQTIKNELFKSVHRHELRPIIPSTTCQWNCMNII